MRITERQLRRIIREQLEEEALQEGALDWLQGGLDIAGLVPGVGEAADGLNAAISLARGNPIEALLSGISMIPVAGDAVGKGGKIVLKILDPVLPLIKKGGAAAEIVAKIGPDQMAKLKPVLAQFKDLIVKHGPQIKEIFSSVKSADLGAIEKAGGFVIPDLARGKAEELLKKAATTIDTATLESLFTFISEFNVEGGEGGETTDEESAKMDTAVQKLAAGVMHPRGIYLHEHNTIIGYVLGEEYINQELRKIGTFIGKLR